MRKSALVETLTAAATAVLSTALAGGCGTATESVPTTSDATRVQVTLPTGKQVVAETWKSFMAQHPDALREPATHVQVENGSLMFFERSRAYVFLTDEEDRTLPRGQSADLASGGADCCTDLGLETRSCDGMICFCEPFECIPDGRPFVVDEVARVAAVVPRDGWA